MIYSVKSVSTYDVLFCIYIKGYSCKAVLEEVENKVIPVPLHKSGICHKFPVLIDNDRTCRHFVLHFHFLYFSGILYCKLDICCLEVSVWSKFLSECISLPNNQLFDDMRFLCVRCPSVDHISVLIKHGKCCPCKLCPACDVSLCKLKGCRSIFILTVINSSLYLLSLILCIKLHHFIICHISCRLFNFLCNIFGKWIILNKSNHSILIGNCLFKKCTLLNDNLAICIFNILICIKTKYRTSDWCIIFCVQLRNRHSKFLSVIRKCQAFLDNRSLIINISECHFLLIRI